jgi:hypothetical protein
MNELAHSTHARKNSAHARAAQTPKPETIQSRTLKSNTAMMLERKREGGEWTSEIEAGLGWVLGGKGLRMGERVVPALCSW